MDRYNAPPAYDNYGYSDARYDRPAPQYNQYDYNRQATPAPEMYYGNVVQTSNDDDYYWDTVFTRADGTTMVTDKRNNIVPVPVHLLNRQPARQPAYDNRRTIPAYTGYNDRYNDRYNDVQITGAFGDYGQANYGQGRNTIDLGNIRF